MQQISYRTNAHILPGTYALVMVLMGAGTIPMYFSIWQGAGVVWSMIALLLPMLLVAATVTGPADYTIDESGISQTVRPYLLSALFNYSKVSSYKWSHLLSFKNGKDMNRGMQEYEYLTLNFKYSITWKLTDQANQAAFQIFRDAFLRQVEAYNTNGKVDPAKATNVPIEPAAQQLLQATSTSGAAQQSKPGIERKKDFYETGSAKLVYWIFALAVCSLIAFLITHTQYISGTNIFRIAVVILPGMAYFFYRVYGKK